MQAFIRTLMMAILAIGCGACSAASGGGITVKDPWARPTASQATATSTAVSVATMTQTRGMAAGDMNGPVSAAYLVIQNTTNQADRLISVTSSASNVAEVHETKQMDNGMMGMQPVQSGLEIPANSSVDLKPGSYHIMMMKLHQDLLPGQTIKLTLVFQSGKQITVEVPVKAAS